MRIKLELEDIPLQHGKGHLSLITSNEIVMAIEPSREPHLFILSLGSDTKNIGFLANRHLEFHAENILEHVLKR